MQRLFNDRLVRARASRQGGALVMVAVATMAMAALSFSLLVISNSTAREQQGMREELSARYVCEAAIAEATFDLVKGGNGNLGTQNQPAKYGDADYWVTSAALPGNMFQLTATGVDDRAGARMELVLQETTQNIFQWGAFGDTDMTMDSNAMVDSYDSALGDYATQMVNGSGSSAYAGTDGNVGSNVDVTMLQNTAVWGDAVPGPSGTTSVLNNSTVSGSTAPMATTVDFPTVVAPSITSSGNLTVPGATPLTLPAGSYRYEDFVISIGGTVLIEGPAEIVLANCLLNSTAELIVDATNGPVEIWVENDFEMDSNTLIASQTYTPADVQVTLLGDNVYNPVTNINMSNVSFNSNAQMYATVYAPDAEIVIDSNFELFGSLVAQSVLLDSNAKIHYDMALMNLTGTGLSTFDPVCWRVLPFKP